jgi:CarD family transcriptional regulator
VQQARRFGELHHRDDVAVLHGADHRVVPSHATHPWCTTCTFGDTVVRSWWHTAGADGAPFVPPPEIRPPVERMASSDLRSSSEGVDVLFDVGDRVVYPHHGAAVIVRRESREYNGEKTDYLVLQMAHGELTLSVPADKAEEVGMRPPIGGEEVQDLFELLGRKDIREPANWSRRFKNHQEKLKSGDVYQVAEVVRNLALRDQSKGLSAGEKSMFVKARSVLVSELSFALDVSEDDALEQVQATLR